jgi:hypothetical protein
MRLETYVETLTRNYQYLQFGHTLGHGHIAYSSSYGFGINILKCNLYTIHEIGCRSKAGECYADRCNAIFIVTPQKWQVLFGIYILRIQILGFGCEKN